MGLGEVNGTRKALTKPLKNVSFVSIIVCSKQEDSSRVYTPISHKLVADGGINRTS
ncbi:MAG: hypothetical protein ACI8RA_002264 [Chlamydiales bacterium]|jgi:hypothetical protein